MQRRNAAMIALKKAALAAASVAALAFAGAAEAEVSMRRVTFLVENTPVVGDLYLPEGVTAANPRPATVVVGPQTNVKEQVPATYARELAERGYVALAIDHRGFGESGGRVRQFEDPRTKVEDVKSAVTFLRSVPEWRTGGSACWASAPAAATRPRPPRRTARSRPW
jgi:fermentation-respiration switch protein FrsA (DUF1100 family)